MFCRFCYYDLHGQEMPRCPECGTAFAFDDPDSFLQKSPGTLGRIRMLLWLRRRRKAFVVALTILLLGGYAVAGSRLPSGQFSRATGGHARTNLMGIMTEWFIQKNDRPQETTFDIDAAKIAMQPGFSPWTESDASHRRALVTYLFIHAPFFVITSLVYLLLVATAVGRRARWGIVVLVAALSFVLLGSLSPRQTASRLCPGSYVFLSDIVFLSDVDLTSVNPQRARTIAAYDVQSFRRPGRRLIAFESGSVEFVQDDRAKSLFQAQGLPYPEQSD